jgi:N-acetylgalactosamine-6-sulfatase
LYEGGICTPFLVRWPGKVPANKVDNDSVIGGADLLPTVCRLAGASLPARAQLDGEDVSAAWMGKPGKRAKPLLWENRYPVYRHVLDMSPMLAIRESSWKLLMNPDRGRVELYDAPADRSEMHNRAAENPAVVNRLAKRLLDWQATLPKGPVDPGAGKNTYPWPKPM